MNTHDDDALTKALAALPRHDVTAMEARAMFTAAELHLRAKVPVTRWMRAEPLTMTLLAIAHLCWALARVYGSH